MAESLCVSIEESCVGALGGRGVDSWRREHRWEHVACGRFHPRSLRRRWPREFQNEQVVLRRTDVALPVPPSLVDGVPELVEGDILERPALSCARIGILSNAERH